MYIFWSQHCRVKIVPFKLTWSTHQNLSNHPKSALITNNWFVIQSCTKTNQKALSEHKLREMFPSICSASQHKYKQQQRFSALKENLGIKISWGCRRCGLMAFKCLNAASRCCCSRKERFPVVILVSAVFLLPLPQQLPPRHEQINVWVMQV